MHEIIHASVVQKGLDMSLIEMVDELNEIREVALIYHNKRNKSDKNQVVLSRLNPRQKRLSEILEIPAVLSKG